MVYKWIINSLSELSPAQCQLCGEPTSSEDVFCEACWQDMPRFVYSCPLCGNELASQTKTACGQCLKHPPAYDQVRSAFAYDIPIRQLVSRFKFLGQLKFAPLFANCMKQVISQSTQTVDAILPVPLHPERLRQRGFNQAIEFSRPLARELNLPVLIDYVSRSKKTEVQSTLSAFQRQQNIRNAFKIDKPIPFKRIAIVDDVMTTGSTVNELASLLKDQGVEFIEVWCIARASVCD